MGSSGMMLWPPLWPQTPAATIHRANASVKTLHASCNMGVYLTAPLQGSVGRLLRGHACACKSRVRGPGAPRHARAFYSLFVDP